MPGIGTDEGGGWLMSIYKMQGQSVTFAPNSITTFLLQSGLGFIEIYGILKVNI